MSLRLDKYLADMGIGTRSDLKKAIRSGAVSVNGTIVNRADTRVNAGDDVEYLGKPVVWRAFEYYMMNKPAGVITATEGPGQRTVTVMDLVPSGTRRDLAPVGRLDKDTEGLLLLTNDGDLTHRLLAPGKHVPKRYFALLDRPATEENARQFAEGLYLPEDPEAGTARGREAFSAAPARLFLPGSTFWEAIRHTGDAGLLQPPQRMKEPGGQSAGEAVVEITEGRFHQVKRMFAAVGLEVVYLRRISMGALTLDPALAPGQVRELTGQELESLRNPAF